MSKWKVEFLGTVDHNDPNPKVVLGIFNTNGENAIAKLTARERAIRDFYKNAHITTKLKTKGTNS